MSFSFWQKGAAVDSESFDYVVVGGGIVGVSAAYWYRKMYPDRTVAVLEARSLASGASGRNAGFVLQGTATDYLTDIERYGSDMAGRLYRLTCKNRELIEAELDPSTFSFQDSGSIIAAATQKENDRLHDSVGPIRSAGGSVIYLNRDQLTDKISSRGFFGGLLVSTGAMVNPVLLVRRIARKSDAVIHTNTRVEAVEQSGDLITLFAGNRTVSTSAVTFALNAYLPVLFPQLSEVVRPVRAQMLATNPIGLHLHYPVYSHEGYFYIRQSPAGNVLVGGARHLHSAEEVGYVDAVTDNLQADLEKYVRHHFPDLEYDTVDGRWSGVMGFSPDGLPCVGIVPGLDNEQYWAAGFTGHGMSIGFLMGKFLAELAAGQQPEDAQIFGVNRLSAAKP